MKAKSLTLSAAETAEFGREIDQVRQGVVDDLGQRDVDHIRKMIRVQRYSEAGGRALLHFGFGPFSFVAGVGALAAAKILENMEIGHNIMHGQYDWTKDPDLNGSTYEWDTACTGDEWRKSHNFEHHTFTNIHGKDRDVGYGILRVSDEQPWNPQFRLQPLSALLLALGFQYGVGAHDLRLDEYMAGKRPWKELPKKARPFLNKAGWQIGKDYVLFPAISLWNWPRVLSGNFLANLIRNVWAFAIIFCGHFPDGTKVFREEDTENETRAAWYLRQVHGSANLEGSRLFYIATGHLSHQIEHHLFPDLPAERYEELAPKIREICERYGQTYNTGGFWKQFGSVVRRIWVYSGPNVESGATAKVVRRQRIAT
jgi:fatty acid desaturase